MINNSMYFHDGEQTINDSIKGMFQLYKHRLNPWQLTAATTSHCITYMTGIKLLQIPRMAIHKFSRAADTGRSFWWNVWRIKGDLKCTTMGMRTCMMTQQRDLTQSPGFLECSDVLTSGLSRFNLPSFPRDSSSFWIWFSRKNMATAKASSARSCNLGGIMTLSSPIKSSREGIWSVHARRRTHWKRTQSDGADYKAGECRCMALSLSRPPFKRGFIPMFRSSTAKPTLLFPK